MDEDSFVQMKETFLATIVRLLALEGAAREVAILAGSKSQLEQTSYDNWNGGTYGYTLYLRLPLNVYSQVDEKQKEQIQIKILEKLNQVAKDDNCFIDKVMLLPDLIKDDEWKEKANNWLKGKDITNQGRVRSDNIASRMCDGLLFRSQAEINFYKAIKSLGVSFAPLPVFVRGGPKYRRIEPDFIIIKDGIVLVVEIDGDTVHTETPAEAHDRTTMLLHEGVNFERIKASECQTEESAKVAAKNILMIIDKLRNNR